MGKVKEVDKALLFIGILYTDEELLKNVVKELKKEYGKTIDYIKGIDFDVTDYYEDEMGKNIKKAFIVFEKLINMENLSKIKLKTNNIEEKFQDTGNNRKINLDPGYLTLSKVVLATTKNRGHRIYLGDGIFAEVTLYYYDNSYRSFDWTYPDFKKDKYIKFFNEIRKNYKEMIS